MKHITYIVPLYVWNDRPNHDLTTAKWLRFEDFVLIPWLELRGYKVSRRWWYKEDLGEGDVYRTRTMVVDGKEYHLISG
jgi:hypothetical protein